MIRREFRNGCGQMLRLIAMADHNTYKPFQDSIKEFDENTIKGGPMYVNKLEKS
jgi:hypothetical protein